jgi:hypothetical protein
LAPRRIDFWRSVSHFGTSFVAFSGHFSSLGSTLGALEPHFFITKEVPKCETERQKSILLGAKRK